MALQIVLVKTPAKVSVSKTSHTFSKQSGTLGRADSNEWVLPDPDKFLSSCHCEVLFDASTYFLLDLSTNGTFYNNSLEPLGKGTKVPLNDGDFFDVGEYRFSVKVVVDQSFVGNSPFAPKSAVVNSAGASDIFSGGEPSASSFADPFTGNGFLPADFSLDSDSSSADPLLALDHARKPANKDLYSGAPLFDTVQSSAPKHDDFVGFSQTDHSPSLDQSISWPAAAQENLIPEDWGGDFMEPSVVPSAPKNRNNFSSAPSLTTNQSQRSPFPQAGEALSQKVQSAAPLVEQPPLTPQPSVPVQALSEKIATKPAAGVNVGPKNGNVVARVSRSPSNDRLIAAMGLDAGKLSVEQIDEISDVVGELMREVVEGMMQVLRSRTSIKNEFRMNVTTIQPVENNPLKFSVGVDEALENMFIKKTNAYKKPVDAFREGFQEIGEHQVAMIAGIRFGFERMVERFNPENLERNFNKHGKGGVIPGMQKVKYWNNYREYYSGFLDNMESSFQHLFGSDFVNAYEDQLRKLASARKKNR